MGVSTLTMIWPVWPILARAGPVISLATSSTPAAAGLVKFRAILIPCYNTSLYSRPHDWYDGALQRHRCRWVVPRVWGEVVVGSQAAAMAASTGAHFGGKPSVLVPAALHPTISLSAFINGQDADVSQYVCRGASRRLLPCA